MGEARRVLRGALGLGSALHQGGWAIEMLAPCFFLCRLSGADFVPFMHSGPCSSSALVFIIDGNGMGWDGMNGGSWPVATYRRR